MLRALDLFCGAGGATKGLQRAGFHVTGVDINPQPNYCGDAFVQGDALNPPMDLRAFALVWASPKCQAHSALRHMPNAGQHENQVPPTRALLQASGRPFIIENVPGAPLLDPITLCGSMFGLGVWRHRNFEVWPRLLFTPQCQHDLCPEPVDVTGKGSAQRGPRKKKTGGLSRKPRTLDHAAQVMGVDWMTHPELSQAIPPAYAEFLGRHLLPLL